MKNKNNNRNGNINRYTNNTGHDTAKNNLNNKLKSTGFNIYNLRLEILKHPIIKDLQNKKAIKISDITGQNFYIACKNQPLADFRKLKFNNNQYVVQVVNNICNSIVDKIGYKNYLKTWYWKKLNKKIYTYSDVIYFGGDILTYNWTQENYTQKEFTCKLNYKQKDEKYRPLK